MNYHLLIERDPNEEGLPIPPGSSANQHFAQFIAEICAPEFDDAPMLAAHNANGMLVFLTCIDRPEQSVAEVAAWLQQEWDESGASGFFTVARVQGGAA